MTRDDIRELLPLHTDSLSDPAFLVPPLGRSLEALGDDLAAGASAETQRRLVVMRRGAAAGAAAEAAVRAPLEQGLGCEALVLLRGARRSGGHVVPLSVVARRQSVNYLSCI